MVLSTIFSALLSQNAIAATGIHKTINFQGKVVNSDGTNVVNGTYQFQFKLYTVSSGGVATWTETKNVAVTDGIFQTELGDTTSLPGSVDFNSDNIYLGINFNPGTGLDGEMSPRIRFTSSPYAFNSDLLDGLDSSAFAQLSPGSAQSGFLNVTGNVTSGATVAAATSVQAPLMDTATAVALGVGTGTASSVTVGRATSGTNLTLQGSASTSWSATGASGSTTVNFANPTATNTITFPNAGGTVCTNVASTCSATYQAAGAYLAKNAADSSSFAVTAANYLYGFTNSNATPTTGGVLQLNNGANTGDTLLVTASGNPAATKALIVANNTAGVPSGNLIDLQVGGVSKFAVSTTGAVTTSSTINSQTISATASFTGTVAVTSSLSAAGLSSTLGVTSTGASVNLNVGSNFATNINTGGSTGQVTIGNGSAPLAIDSTGLDVSTAGALSGITTIATSSTINSQTISSSSNFTGTVTIQGSNALTLGVTGSATGAALFKGSTAASGTITVKAPNNPSASNNTLTLPDETGTLCVQNSANCGFLVGATTDFIQNQNTAAQTSSNFWISGSGRATTSLLAPLIATADVTTGTSSSLVLRSGNGTAGGASSGNVTVDAGSKNAGGFAGNLYLGNTNALTVNIGRNSATATGTAVSIMGLAATSNIVVNDATNTNKTTITYTTPTAARAINFPDASGAICLDSGNCGGATGYILNQTGTNQTANFQITGTGRANGQLQAPLFDTPSGTTTLNIGTNNATAGINLNQNTTIATGKSLTVTSGALTQSGGAVSLAGNAASSLTTTSGALTITSAAATSWSTSAGDLAVYAAGNLNLGGSGGGTVNIGAVGSSTSASTIHIADTSNATGAQNITVGSGANASSLTTIQGGTAASGGVVLSATTVGLSATNLQFASGGARNILVAQAGAGAGNDLTVSAGQGASGQTGGNLTLQAGANGTATGTPGSVIVKSNGGNSASAFDVQNSTNVSQFKVDTANSQIITPGLTIQSANITPNTAMTVGSTTQAFTMQGSGTSTITATNASSTTALIFQTPTANVNYQFKTTTAGTYTVCTTELSSCGTGSTGYLRKGVANETSNANLTVANDLLYTFSNSGSAQTGVLKVDNGAGTGSALQVTAAATPVAGKALIFASNTLNNATGNLIDLWSTQSATSASRFSVSSAGAVVSGTINGQTIAATSQLAVVNTSGLLTANSLNVTNAATFSSGLTVNTAALVANAGASITGGINNNAGGITGAGAVSGITSLQFSSAGSIDANAAVAISIGTTQASALNIGRAGGTLSLQGNTSSSLVISNGTNTTTIRGQNPTSNIIYEFASGTGGTYQICSTLAATCGSTYANYYANGYIQMEPAAGQTDSATGSGIWINKTGLSGNILRLQSSGVDELTVQSNGTLIAGASAYLGGTSANYGLFMDTTNFKVRVGTGTPTLGGGGSNSTAALFVSGSAEFAGTIRVGDGTNNATYDGTTKEVTYNGTARHSRRVMLTPEYLGAVMSPNSSTGTTGLMTSDFCAASNLTNVTIPTTVAFCPTSGDYHNYYKWTSVNGSSQTYDIYVDYVVPSDFGAFTSDNSITMNGYRTGSSDNVQLSLFQANGTQCGSTTSVSTSNAAWTTTTLGGGGETACSIAAGDRLTFRVRLTSTATTNSALAGEIYFDYLSKW